MVDVLTDSQLDALTELYIAYFCRAPENDGLSFHTDAVLDQLNGTPPKTFEEALKERADQFYLDAVAEPEFTGYSTSLTAEEFVVKLYANVLAREDGGVGGPAPTDAEIAFWVTKIEGGELTRGETVQRFLEDQDILAASGTDAEKALAADAQALFDNRTEVAREFALPENSAGLTGAEAFAAGKAALALVTPDPASVALAIATFENGVAGDTLALTPGADFANESNTVLNGIVASDFLFTGANETINAGPGTLTGLDILQDGSTTDTDTLNASTVGAGGLTAISGAFVQNIEDINVSMTAQETDTLSLDTFLGVQSLHMSGDLASGADLTIDMIKNSGVTTIDVSGVTGVAGGAKETVTVDDGSSTGADQDLTFIGGDLDTTVRLDDGDNTITTGAGDDEVVVDDGANTIDVGEGDNMVTVGKGNNTITAGDDDDDVTAGDGNNIINAGGGKNVISVGDGDNTITTGDDDDVIAAEDGDNIITSGDGDNTITTTGGDGTITVGGEQGDVMSIATGDGDDTISAGDGDNFIFSAGGDNTITVGGEGDDNTNSITTGDGDDTIVAGDAGGIFAGFGNTIFAGDGDNSVTTGDAVDGDINFIVTGTGKDTIEVGDGGYSIFSGAGKDTIIVGDDGGTVGGGADADTITLGSANSTGSDVVDINQGESDPTATGFDTIINFHVDEDFIDLDGPFILTYVDLGPAADFAAALALANSGAGLGFFLNDIVGVQVDGDTFVFHDSGPGPETNDAGVAIKLVGVDSSDLDIGDFF